MNRLPPISRDRSPVVSTRRASSPASPSIPGHTDNLIPSPEYHRKRSHRLPGNLQPTEIVVTDEGDINDVVDIRHSVRRAMWSPVPRSLNEDVIGKDKSVWVSRHISHPKITIDMCCDLQKGQQKSVNRKTNFGAPIVRSVSENMLLSAPSPIMQKHTKLYSAKSCNELNTDFTRKLSINSHGSEGNIPLSLNESRRFQIDDIQKSSASGSSRWSEARMEHGLPLMRSPKCRSVSTDRNAVCRQSFCGSSTDSDSRPSSPVPDCSLGSPHWSTVGSPPNSPRLSPCSSPVSPSRLSANFLEGHLQASAYSSTCSTRGSRSVPTSPNRTTGTPTPSSLRKSERSPGASIRLLPLRTDRQEV